MDFRRKGVRAIGGPGSVGVERKSFLRNHNRTLVLPVTADGSLPLDVSLLGSLRRVDMDDVLVNVERIDRGTDPDPAIVDFFADQTVLLGTVGAADAGSGIRMDSGRQFSLVEFQGLALASLQASLVPQTLSLPWSVLCILAAVIGGIAIIHAKASLRLCLTVSLLAGWMLFAISLFGMAALVPPVITPIVVLLAAFLLSPVLQPKASEFPSAQPF